MDCVIGSAAPYDVGPRSPTWIGAWWIGFLVCGVLYLLCVLPLVLFPHKLPRNRHQIKDSHELAQLRDNRLSSESEPSTQCCQTVVEALKRKTHPMYHVCVCVQRFPPLPGRWCAIQCIRVWCWVGFSGHTWSADIRPTCPNT